MGLMVLPAIRSIVRRRRARARLLSMRDDICFLPRRADRAQHGFARPAIYLEAGRFLVGTERRTGLHPGLAVDLVGIETDTRETALHGFDVGGAQLARCR